MELSLVILAVFVAKNLQIYLYQNNIAHIQHYNQPGAENQMNPNWPGYNGSVNMPTMQFNNQPFNGYNGSVNTPTMQFNNEPFNGYNGSVQTMYHQKTLTSTGSDQVYTPEKY